MRRVWRYRGDAIIVIRVVVHGLQRDTRHQAAGLTAARRGRDEFANREGSFILGRFFFCVIRVNQSLAVPIDTFAKQVLH